MDILPGEGCGWHNLIFYPMLAGMIAGMVSLIIVRHSLYDHLKVRYPKKLESEVVKAEVT